MNYEYKQPGKPWTRIHPNWLDRMIVDLCGGGCTSAQTQRALLIRGVLNDRGHYVSKDFSIRRVKS